MAKYSAAVRMGQLLMEAREIDVRGRPILRHTPIAAATAASRRLRPTRERSPPKHKSSYLIKVSSAFVSFHLNVSVLSCFYWRGYRIRCG